MSRFRRALGSGYITADLNDFGVDVQMDITNITFADETFKIIYCSHVLEHVPDDKAAMGELHRVLKADGWAILLVPITVPRTIEDSNVTDAAERLRLFGQEDHVRRYGPDYLERLQTAGFVVRRYPPCDFLNPREIKRMGITKEAGEIYLCRKNPIYA